MKNRIKQFYGETVTELRKCTWPSRDELKDSTIVVICSVVLLSAFVALVDWLCQVVIRWVTVAS